MYPPKALLLSISPSKVARVLLLITLLLTGLSLLGAFTQLSLNYKGMHRYVHHLVEKFNVDTELSVPAFYNVLLLLIASCLSWFIGRNQTFADALPNRWSLLAFVFFLLAMDEGIGIHEYFNGSTLKNFRSVSKYLYWTWVIPYALFSLTFFVLYVPFLWSLPARIGRLLVAAGAIYVGGAIGVEMLGAGFYTDDGKRSIGYLLMTHLEEMMEMTGLVVFIYALTVYIRERWSIAIQHRGSSSDYETKL
jgi:hypothetical protein